MKRSNWIFWAAVGAIAISVDRSNAIEVASFSVGLLAAVGLHTAADEFVDNIGNVSTEWSRLAQSIIRVVPPALAVLAMGACVFLVHANFDASAEESLRHATTESTKSIFAIYVLRHLRHLI